MNGVAAGLSEEDLLRRRLERERAARRHAETLLEAKSLELYERNRLLEVATAERIRAQAAAAEAAAVARQEQATRVALERLKEAQEQLMNAEKLASLGSLVAGVAHEINTPVGIGVTAASHLRDETQSTLAAHRDGKLTRSQFEAFLADCRQSGDIILGNLQRAADLISSFKRVAVDQSSDERRCLNVRAYIGEVLLALQPRLRHTAQQVRVDCPADLVLETLPGAWSQILTNLVVNALTHAYEPSTPGTIRIAVAVEDGTVLLRFADDGRGIAPEHLPRIFDPFFTTRRGQGGSGLGLHVVFNLVHQTLGGRIGVRSAPGQGTEFTIALPVVPPASAANGKAP